MTVRTSGWRGIGRQIGLALLGVAVALAAGGCQERAGHADKKKRAYKPVNLLTVPVDDAGCPGRPSFDVQDCDPDQTGRPPPDCGHAPTKKMHKLTLASQPKGRGFALQFDPFGGSRIEIAGEKPFTIEDQAKPGTYTFIVVPMDKTLRCPSVDPQLILD
jgi:hypothetical protein